MFIETSENVCDLAAALAKAQAVMAGATKDASNPHFGSKYADLASVWEAARKPLSDHGLSVIQSPFFADGKTGVVTTLLHASGQWVRGVLCVPTAKLDAQGVGSALTYCRRYALAAMVGVAPEDDDGNAASGAPLSKPDKPARRQPPARVQATTPSAGPPTTPTATVIPEEEQRNSIRLLYFRLPQDTQQKFLAWASVESVDDLPADKLAKAETVLRAKLTEVGA